MNGDEKLCTARDLVKRMEACGVVVPKHCRAIRIWADDPFGVVRVEFECFVDVEMAAAVTEALYGSGEVLE